MKDFNITKDCTVTLFGKKEPLPVNTVYGRVKSSNGTDGVYIFYPCTMHLETYNPKGIKLHSEVFRTYVEKHVLTPHKRQWVNLGKPEACRHIQEIRDTRHKASQKRPVVGSPMVKTNNVDTVFRANPKSRALKGGIDWEYNPDGFVSTEDKKYGYNGLPVVSDSRACADYVTKSFEVGQNTAGPAQYVPKHESLQGLDRTHGKSDRIEREKITFPKKTFPSREYTEEESRAMTAALETNRAERFKLLGWKDTI